jgi:hypothetical protein
MNRLAGLSAYKHFHHQRTTLGIRSLRFYDEPAMTIDAIERTSRWVR